MLLSDHDLGMSVTVFSGFFVKYLSPLCVSYCSGVKRRKPGWWWSTSQCSESPACASSVEQGNSSLLPFHSSGI